jgi:hypothetical protein
MGLCWGLRFLSGPEVLPGRGFTFEEGAEVAQAVGAGCVPAYAGAFEAAGDDAFAGQLDATDADFPAVFDVGRVVHAVQFISLIAGQLAVRLDDQRAALGSSRRSAVRFVRTAIASASPPTANSATACLAWKRPTCAVCYEGIPRTKNPASRPRLDPRQVGRPRDQHRPLHPANPADVLDWRVVEIEFPKKRHE